PTRKALIMDLAPEGKKAGMFGVYYLVRDTIVSLSAFAGAFLWREGAEYNLIAAAAFGVAGTVFFAIRGRDVTPSKA
ncbi:MAG: MFS transporter, partial [Planctomycetota bacterium]|nr:MFS transporter [Planctomycetota bacterium]